MDAFLFHAGTLAGNIAPVIAVFAALALLTKRRRILVAFRKARVEGTTNLGLLLINSVLLAPFFAIPMGAVHNALGGPDGWGDAWMQMPLWLSFAIAILLLDFTAYWRHRLEHDRALWRFHATHHADTAMHWLSVQRKHPVAKLLSLLVDGLPLIVLGCPIAVVAAAYLARSWWGYFTHADVPWTLGPLGKVLISPAAHRLHHIRDETLMGANYANTFAFIDRAFGTWRDPAPHLNCETGIAEGTRGLLGEIARPFEARYRNPKAAAAETEEAAGRAA
jgi:sterol desaturase/sphingolipid hydroxylase (fatty acid hydroxylase superfamily)